MTTPTLADAQQIFDASRALVDRALDRARDITDGGARIDDHQVMVEQVAYAATQARAAQETIAAVTAAKAEGSADAMLETTAAASVALLGRDLKNRIESVLENLGLDESALEQTFTADVRATLRRTAHEEVFRGIGKHTCETRGQAPWPVDEMCDQVRAAVREFAEQEVAPEAERIHRNDDLVPEKFISEMAELGYFGLAVEEKYGGSEMGNLAMILTTEELSRASLAGAGSLITRPRGPW